MPAPVSARSRARRAGGRRRRRRRARSWRSGCRRRESSTSAPGALDAQRDGVLDGQQLGAEPARLVGRAAGEVRAAQARRGSRGSSRSGSTGRPARRAPRARPSPCAGPPRRRRPRPPARPGRRRRSRGRSGRRPAAPATPRRSASSSTVGRSSTVPSSSSATGSRSSSTPATVSSSRASPSRSTSSQRAGHAVAGEEVAQVVRVAREAVADDAHAAGLERRARLPRRQQVLDDRVQLLLGRVPRLEQVVVERDLVDRRDRRLGVGVGGQQHALGVGHELARLDEVLGARHAGHALVGDQQRDLVAARDELAQDVERLRPEPARRIR